MSCWSCSAAADDIFALSLEELQNIEVSVASITQESLNTVPSTVSVFTQADIQKYGVRDLYELLNFVPGMQVTRGERLTSIPKPQARGIFLDNGYLLFLINGKRMNEVSFGKASVFNPSLPLEWVDRVEIIRGPGSVIYGSNAFMGVINIITRKDNGQTVKISAGNHGKKHIGAYSGTQRFGGHVNVKSSHGATHKSQLGEYQDPYDQQFGNLFWHHGGFYADVDWMKYQYPENINLGGLSQDNEYQSDNIYTRAGLNTSVSSHTQIQFESQYSQHEVKSAGKVLGAGDIPNLSHDFLVGPWWKTHTSQVRFNAAHNISASDILSVGIGWKNEEMSQAGVSSTHIASDNSDAIPDDAFYQGKIRDVRHLDSYQSLKDNLTSQELYLEWRSIWWQNIHTFIGIRHDDYQDLGNKTVPRISVIYQSPLDHHKWRLQYSEAFRTPVFNELYSNDSVTLGNPNLNPESVATLELEWQYSMPTYLHQFILFQNKTTDFIINTELTSDPNRDTFKNALSDEFIGIEYDGVFSVAADVELKASFTHLLDQPDTAAFQNFSSLSINHLGAQHIIGSTILYRSSVRAKETHYKNGEYGLLGVHGRYHWSKQWTFGFTLHNVTNENVTNYERRFSANDFHMPDSPRTFLLDTTFSF